MLVIVAICSSNGSNYEVVMVAMMIVRRIPPDACDSSDM